MPRIIFEAVLDSSGAITGLKKLEGGLESLGTQAKKGEDSLASQNRELKRLMDRLEPTRVATERLTKQKELLRKALAESAVTMPQYQGALAKLESTSIGLTGKTTGLAGAMDSLFKVAAGYVTFDMIRRSVTASVTAFAEAQEAQTRLESVLRATGGTVGHTSDQLADMAEKYMKLTGVSDEVIKQGQTVLMTFQSIRGEAFERTIAVALDLSTVLGTDLQSAIQQVGKALEDPERGLTALRRAGIVFSEDQEKLIKSLADTNRLAEAQTMILDALEKKVGGTAQAVGETLPGAWRKFKVAMDEMLEVQGEAISTGFQLTSVLGLLTSAINKLGEVQKTNLQRAKDFFSIFKSYQDQAKPTAGLDWTTAWQEMAPPVDAIAKLDEWAKEQKKSAEEVEKHNKAARDFNLTAAAQAKAVDTLTEKLRNQVLQREALSDLEERFSSDVTKTLKDMSRLLTEYANAQVDANVELRTWLALLEQQGMVRPREGFFPNTADYFGGIKESANQFGDLFAESFADAFIGFMQGDDFGDLWTGLWESLAGGAAAKFGKAFDALFSGADWKAAMEAGGLYNPEGKGFVGKWGGAIGAGGALLSAYNIRQKEPSRALGVVGGAASGFAAGASLGPWGMVVGAILGGLMGYFGSQGTAKHGYSYGFRGTEGYVGEVSGGVTKEQEKDLQRTMTAVYRTTAFAFRDILKQLGVAPGALKGVTVPTISGKAADPVQVLTQFIKGELPRKVFEVYRDTLTEALTQFKVGDKFAVSAKKAEELMANFTNLPFDQALAALQNYVAALVELDELHEDLSKSLEELEAEIGATMRGAWIKSVENTLADIRDLSEGLDQLTTEEQVARANQIADLTRQQYEQNLQYLNQLILLGRQVNESFAGMFLGWQETEASEGGPAKLMQWYEQQVYKWQDVLANAATPEEAQKAMEMLQKYFDAMWRLSPEVPTFGESWRDWVETQAAASLEVFNTLMDKWKDEVAQRNQDLLDALDAITAALTGQAGEVAGLNELIDQETGLREDLVGLLDREKTARLSLIETLEDRQLGAGAGAADSELMASSNTTQMLADSAAAALAEVEARRLLISALEAETASRSGSTAAAQSATEAAYFLAEAAGAAGVALSDIQSGTGGGLASTQTARRSA